MKSAIPNPQSSIPNPQSPIRNPQFPTIPADPTPEDEIDAQGCLLAAIKTLQLATGLVGQFWLLSRWAQRPGTDTFVLLSGIPWIAASALLVSGMDDCLPAILNQGAVAGDDARQSRLIAQITGFTVFLSLLAALLSGAVIALWALRLDLPTHQALLMGAALGGQLLPYGLATLWHGYLTARDRIVLAHLPLLAGSTVTLLGYGLARGNAAVALPAITLGATVATMLLTWVFTRAHARRLPGAREILTAALMPWEPEILHLLSNLVAAGIAAALVHVEALLLRANVSALGAGSVTALSLAQRGWDALLSLVMASTTLAAYSEWSRGSIANPALLRRVLRRSWILTLAAAALAAGGFWVLGPWAARLTRQPAVNQAITFTWALLPHFILLSGIQPLVLRHFAAGEPWHPVLSSAAGLALLALALRLAIPRWGAAGLALAAALAPLPGWLYLGWRTWRQEHLCVF